MANRTNKKTNRFNIKNINRDQIMNAGLHIAVLLLAVFAINGVMASLDGGIFVRSIISIAFVSALLFATFVLIERMKTN